ncbi:MAG: hypothetical protein A2744_02230 [Candidatus Buchananbacteria bacterium RIFCSPHIGHO2_01_FULL_44_11]|uniref:VanZ-like domain-containing protein n=1 Tax=Candidatus Buchananbacteria bacterium RIFCSPHIGHO2_01_FULL_44_11 TaxID=1797535 RepID=A0A1G1XZF4_9BACT|nr:MAG: hypothetical protein A2744_02230 [Candidatus Buchananbacteria bacterium RIFCSPHIGHO2_01_FULL_44_11]
MTLRTKQFINWLVVILWLGVIYYFSHQPDLKSELEPFWDLIFRKIAHMAEYFVLTFLLFRALGQYRLSSKKRLVLALFLAVLSAATDEWHQSFIKGRSASLLDVGVDSIGTLTFIILNSLQLRKTLD